MQPLLIQLGLAADLLVGSKRMSRNKCLDCQPSTNNTYLRIESACMPVLGLGFRLGRLRTGLRSAMGAVHLRRVRHRH